MGVICWVALLKKEGKRCASINIESYWPVQGTREERVNNAPSISCDGIKKHRPLMLGAFFVLHPCLSGYFCLS